MSMQGVVRHVSASRLIQLFPGRQRGVIREDALLQVVSQLLPLPHLRCGFLLTADPERRAAVDETWASCWFVLDHVSLRTAPLQERGGAGERLWRRYWLPVLSWQP